MPKNTTVSRKKLIKEGMLKDVTGMAIEVGLSYPTAFTVRAWDEYISPNTRPSAQGGIKGRIRTVLKRLKETIEKKTGKWIGSDIVIFPVDIVFTGRCRTVELKASCLPGDDGKPVITLAKGED